MTLAEKKKALAEARAAQKMIDQLPSDLRAWNMQYFQAMEEDIAANQSAAADRTRDSPVVSGFDWRPILNLAGEVAWAAIKKHWPTASIATGLSALVSLGISYLSK